MTLEIIIDRLKNIIKDKAQNVHSNAYPYFIFIIDILKKNNCISSYLMIKMDILSNKKKLLLFITRLKAKKKMLKLSLHFQFLKKEYILGKFYSNQILILLWISY
jgi:hypothetical protein